MYMINDVVCAFPAHGKTWLTAYIPLLQQKWLYCAIAPAGYEEGKISSSNREKQSAILCYIIVPVAWRILLISILCPKPEALRRRGIVRDVAIDEANRRNVLHDMCVSARKCRTAREAAFTPHIDWWSWFCMLRHQTQKSIVSWFLRHVASFSPHHAASGVTASSLFNLFDYDGAARRRAMP